MALNYVHADIEQTLQDLHSTADSGLSFADAAARLEKFGRNALPSDEGTKWLALILGQFTDLMVVILLAAAVISALLGDSKDVIVIMAIVVLNAVIGIYQEYKAERALAALNAMQVSQVRVRRDGEVRQISADELVPGDVVLLGEGDRVPADGRVIESINLQVEEAALTGESLPVEKNIFVIPGSDDVPLGDRHNMVFMGTTVNYGRGEMAVTRTGLDTELGHIAKMLMQVEQGTTPLERRLDRLAKILALGAGVVVAIVFVAGVLRGIPVQSMFLTAISLAVAAVPEGLPALITISLSLGGARMIKRNALIRRLPAVETLGSVSVICSDKTGTLTKNEMTVTQVQLPGADGVRVGGSGYAPKGDFLRGEQPVDAGRDLPLRRLLQTSALCTNAFLQQDERRYSIVGDTTEGALIVAAQKAGWTREHLEDTFPRVAELPFSSERKAMTTVHRVTEASDGLLPEARSYFAITKGAPDQVVEWAARELLPDGPVALTPERRAAWQQTIDGMAGQGLRVLGVAYRPLELVPQPMTPDVERELIFLGLLGILDPPRPEARDAVQTARAAGIRTIMITGDHLLTAETIARQLTILPGDQRAVTGTQLDTLDDAGLVDALGKTSTFARVSPEHKLRLVRALQAQQHIAAMTGDGVNDAPALKQADIGVAMGITGTDVSKGAAAMVLTDDNFASIVAAVEEGRIIYDNIRKFIKYLLSSNVAEILVMFIALMVGLKIPMLAIQILWINLVTDGLPAIALGFERAERDIMQRKPRPINESIFADGMGVYIIWVALLLTVLTLGSYVLGYTGHGMDPLSTTLGIEQLERAKVVSLSDEALVPADWDTLTPEARTDVLLEHENDAGGLEAASGGIIGAAERIPRTIAFTVLGLGQIFQVMAIHGGAKESFFRIGFKGNRVLLLAVVAAFGLQLAVIYLPFMQAIFETAALSVGELVLTFGLASLMLFGVEFSKLFRLGN